MRFLFTLLCLSLMPVTGNTADKASETPTDTETAAFTPEQIETAKNVTTNSVERARIWRATVRKKRPSYERHNEPSVMNWDCAFHKAADKPFPDDYRFQNPVFSSKMEEIDRHYPYEKWGQTLHLTPNQIHVSFSETYQHNDEDIDFNQCRLIEDASTNITYICGTGDQTHYVRFHATRVWERASDDGTLKANDCLIQAHTAPRMDFLSRTQKMTLFRADTRNCGDIEGLDYAYNFSSDPCFPEDQLPPYWYATDDGTCLPPQKMPVDHVVNPLLKKHLTIQNINYWLGFKINKNGEKPYFSCQLIGQTPSSVTLRCEGIGYYRSLYKVGFLRLRSVGFQNEYASFKTLGCSILVFSASEGYSDNSEEDTFARLERDTPRLIRTGELECGPTEQIDREINWKGLIFYADACQAPSEPGVLTAPEGAFTFPTKGQVGEMSLL